MRKEGDVESSEFIESSYQQIEQSHDEGRKKHSLMTLVYDGVGDGVGSVM